MSIRVYVIISSRNDNILKLEETMAMVLSEYKIYHLDSYSTQVSSWRRKWNKLFADQKQNENNFYAKEFAKINQEIEVYKPDLILIINPSVSQEYIQKWAERAQLVFWFIDSIVGWQDYDIAKYSKNFVYDRESQQYLQTKGIPSVYCPVGYNAAYAKIKHREKTIDISFVGSPYKKRLQILEHIAKIANAKNWTMKLVGPFFRKRNLLKNICFRLKYPHLCQYVVNNVVFPEQAAELYASSKICLNIHDDRNKGTNPRTFEIMATGSMELMDKRGDYDITIPGKTIVIFSDANEAVQKLEYYLIHEEEREQIARAGQRAVREKRSMEHSLSVILGLEEV